MTQDILIFRKLYAWEKYNGNCFVKYYSYKRINCFQLIFNLNTQNQKKRVHKIIGLFYHKPMDNKSNEYNAHITYTRWNIITDLENKKLLQKYNTISASIRTCFKSI